MRRASGGCEGDDWNAPAAPPQSAATNQRASTAPTTSGRFGLEARGVPDTRTEAGVVMKDLHRTECGLSREMRGAASGVRAASLRASSPQREAHGRALPELAHHTDITAVRGDELLRDREPESAAARVLRLVEAIE